MRTMRLASALALVSLLAVPVASAVSLNPRGIGQALIYPYYTVNKNQDTLISVVNASGIGKAVQVRLREGYNGRDVLGFIVFLSAHDVWTASITQLSDDGGAQLKTSDTSCTVPALAATGVALRGAEYDGTGPVPPDGGPTSITRAREGFIEMIADADIVPGSPTDVAITHVQGSGPGTGVPPDCGALNDATVQADLVTATNGIFGSGSVINVGQGTFFAYNADAIEGFSDIPLWSTDAGYPTGVALGDANSSDATPPAIATAYVQGSDGRPLALDYDFGIDAVSAVLMADSIYNEYLVASTLGANTDWVVTFPTKQMYVDELYGNVPFAPFVEAFHAPGISRIATVAQHYDREEGATQQPPVCDSLCPAPPILYLAYEVNVLSYVAGSSNAFTSGTPSRVLGSLLTYSALDPNGGSGFTHLDLVSGDGGHFLPGGIDPDGNPMLLAGLPAVGFMVYNIINTNAQPGLLANYGGAFAHKATSSCIGVAPCTTEP
jgi:hypothetical protein